MKTIQILLLATSVAFASPIPDFPFLFVSGRSSEDVPTASARITFSIEKENELSEAGEATLQADSKALMALLKENGVKDKDIDASDVSKSRISNDPFDKSKKEIYFRFSQRFEVNITDLSIYPKLAETFIGSDKVSGFNSDFYGGNMREVKARLRVEALKDAKQNAETLATASGTTIGAIHSISERDHSELGDLIGQVIYNEPNMPPYRSEVYKVPLTVEVSYNVRVLYRLAEPKQ